MFDKHSTEILRYDDSFIWIKERIKVYEKDNVSDACGSYGALYAFVGFRRGRKEGCMRAGEIVTFGSFEQDGKTGNGKEPIEWIVLDYDSETNRSLLISRYGLSVEKFQMGNWQTEYCGWANSTARSYMSIFYNRAFTEDEKNRIAETVVRTDGYADSTDKVFLLSAEEAEKYRKSVLAMSNYDLYALSLVKSAEENEYEYLDYYTYSWWLRSPVEGASKNVAIVRGNSISSAEVTAWAAYRPAIWLRLDEE